MKLYFLGPNGTYSELAAKKISGLLNENITLEPVSTISKIVDLLDRDENLLGVLPIENSIEGIVRQSIDTLYLSDVKIMAQIDVKIEHCLFSKGNKNSIKHISSHPQALAQCTNYITSNFDKDIDLISATSTAQAVKSIIDKDETYAAIGSINAAKDLNLNILDKNIGDIKDNKTRFILAGKGKNLFSKKERTSIVFNTKNEAGALLKVLEIFKKYDLNLVYLESRPSKKVFGEYNFFVDIDKGINEINEAIEEIKKECNFYKFLGSYPIF